MIEPAVTGMPASPDFAELIGTIAARYLEGDHRGASVAFVEAVGGTGYETYFDRTMPAGWFDAMVRDIPTFFEVELPASARYTTGIGSK